MTSDASRRANRAYASRNKDKLKERNLQYRLKHPEMSMWRAAKQRAQLRNIEFNITVEDIVIPTHCSIFGFELKRAIGVGKRLDTSPSLDRVDPTKGYTKDNIWVISNKANQMKSSATREDLIRFANWIESTYT